ncbi:hypothetical protein, partial [Sphingomonas ursincola]|uniref:hypothetical protein n=1 Tax=Sphingomonas ursincola TaxID=56361 RepID=UPI0023534CC3
PPHAITSIYTRNYTTSADANPRGVGGKPLAPIPTRRKGIESSILELRCQNPIRVVCLLVSHPAQVLVDNHHPSPPAVSSGELSSISKAQVLTANVSNMQSGKMMNMKFPTLIGSGPRITPHPR